MTAPAAGNTVTTLAPTPVEKTIEPVVVPAENLVTERLADIKANFAKSEAAKHPKSSPAAPATGPAPVEWKEPALGANSSAYPPSKLDGGTVTPEPLSAAKGVSKFVLRSEFDELLERIERFNNRSSQKI